VSTHHTQQIAGTEALKWALGNWLVSRLVIFICIFVVAPHIPLPRPEDPGFRPELSWSEMNLLDGKWYEKIVVQGYEYQRDGRPHDIAFFPLYPGLVWALMRTGLGFAAAGTIISNLAFLGALYLLYLRTAEHYGNSAGRLAVAAMAWFPLSVLCSAVYSESVFLLVTLAFLQTFEKGHYWSATVLAAIATFCRVPGIVIVPTVIVLGVADRLPWRAYLPVLSSLLALSSFMWYQAFRFHDPLAFVHVQAAWEHVTLSSVLSRIYHPINVMRISACPAAILLLWSLRRKLCRLDLLYAGFSLALILLSLQLNSIHRYVFGIASVWVALGLWFSEHRRVGITAVVLSAAALPFESVAWAWHHFLG